MVKATPTQKKAAVRWHSRLEINVPHNLPSILTDPIIPKLPDIAPDYSVVQICEVVDDMAKSIEVVVGGEAESSFEKPLSQLGNLTRRLKLGEPITNNLSLSFRQECLEVDFGSFSTMSVPTLPHMKSESNI
jgi:hypothetical protein